VTATGPSERVLLVSMPFGALERPSLGLGLLQSHCRRADVDCSTRYLNLAFADLIGSEDYLWLSNDVPYTAFAGEWLFAEALYGPRPDDDTEYVERVLHAEWRLGDSEVERLLSLRAFANAFVEDCLEQVEWNRYTFVGFTSTFQQNIASLALAQRLKEHWPATTIAFGGANWEGAMGVALQSVFPFVDLVFSGEADETLLAVLADRRAGRRPRSIRGVSARGVAATAERTESTKLSALDDLPIPDFDPYFEQRAASVAAGVAPTMLAETARGCWWGERSHCTFCGLNGATMAFRAKSPERALQELAYLRERYGTPVFSVVDDILDLRYFDSLIPMLAEARLGIEFFWEIKANLTPRQVKALRDAGVAYVQPGIESLDDHVLGLMRKGTTAFRNVELLKWCKEYGVKPMWNLLYGFPGETADDYGRTVDVMHAIWHLDPPTGYGPIRLDRFSPYHDDPAAFGMVGVRPMAPFAHLYPVEPSVLMDIAYYFDFDYDDGRTAECYAADAVALAQTWMAADDRGELTIEIADGDLILTDTRPNIAGTPRHARLAGWKAAVYLACDRAQPLRALGGLHDDVEEGELLGFLERCVDNYLMIGNGRTWLNTAVHRPAREDLPSSGRGDGRSLALAGSATRA
jgi:ribosomal peptide maturation radical SAM protein 1